MDLRQLRYFLAAVEHGSFRKAASSVGLQESTVSRRIRDLEDHLGASLFIRHNGGVRLTIAGQKYARHVREALRQIGRGAKDVGAIGRSEEGHIRIGIISSMASGFLFDLLREFDKGHCAVRIEFTHGEPVDHVAALRQMKLDAAFITGAAQWPDCEAQHLWSEGVYAVLPADHRLTDIDKLAWQDLVGERFIVSDAAPGQTIHDCLVQRLADLGHHPEIDLQYVNRDNLLSLVALGRGLTVMSEAATATQVPGITYRPIANEILPFCAVWLPTNDNPACRRMLSLARTMSRARDARK